MVYVESRGGRIYLEKARDVRRLTLAFDHLLAAGLPPDESIAFIDAVAKDMI